MIELNATTCRMTHDLALGRDVLEKTISGNDDLSAEEVANPVILISGSISADALLEWPASVGDPPDSRGAWWLVTNNLTFASSEKSLRIAADSPMLRLPSGATGLLVYDGVDYSLTAISQPRTMVTLTVNSGTVTLTSSDLANRLIRMVGTPGSGFDVIFPQRYGEWTVVNDTDSTATLKVTGQSSPPTLTTSHAGIVTVATKVIKLTDIAF